MSSATRASATGPLGAEARPIARRTLRIDSPHAERCALHGPLAWTDYVQPSLAILPPTATLPPAASAASFCASSHCAAPVGAAAEPCHVSRQPNAQPVLRQLERDRDLRTGVRRQRFYPEQWRRLQQPEIERLVHTHGQTLQWIGWERSLPQLYLPAGHLTRAVLDLLQTTLRRTKPSAALDRPMCLRVGSQIGATRSLVLVLEHPQLELSPALMQYLNAPLLLPSYAVQAPADAEELVRARSLLRAIGGSISASRSREGGTQFRLSVPADDRMTLVKTWLEHASHAALPSDAAAGQPCASQTGEHKQHPVVYQAQVSMFVVGRREAETVSELNRADARLQSLASSGDFVYRAARSRWLWLTMHNELPPLESPERWQSQLISRWNCLVEATILTEQQTAAFHGLARAIVARIDTVLGRRVPPLDVLIAPPPRSRHLRIDHASAARTAGPSRQPARVSLGAGVTPSAGQRRWRYPI